MCTGQLTRIEASLAKALCRKALGWGCLLEHDIAQEIESGRLQRVLARLDAAKGQPAASTTLTPQPVCGLYGVYPTGAFAQLRGIDPPPAAAITC